MKTIRWVAFVAIIFLLMGVMGAAVYKVYAQGLIRESKDIAPSGDNRPVLQAQVGITPEEAEAIALAQYPGAKVLGTELENEAGIRLYEIELDNGAEVEIDATTGTILPAEAENSAADDRDDLDDDEDDAREATVVNGQNQPDEIVPTNTGITADEAKKIAEQANPGASALSVDFDREGGHEMWEVELSNNIELEVDANSGTILATKQND